MSCHDRAIPIRKQMITSTAIVLTAPESCGRATTWSPAISCNMNVAASPNRNKASRAVAHPSPCNRRRERSDATTNTNPPIATTTADHPIFSPGTKANRDIDNAFVNAVRAAAARTR